MPREQGWGGWLGRYQKALNAAATIESQSPAKQRDKKLDLGR